MECSNSDGRDGKPASGWGSLRLAPSYTKHCQRLGSVFLLGRGLDGIQQLLTPCPRHLQKSNPSNATIVCPKWGERRLSHGFQDLEPNFGALIIRIRLRGVYSTITIIIRILFITLIIRILFISWRSSFPTLLRWIRLRPDTTSKPQARKQLKSRLKRKACRAQHPQFCIPHLPALNPKPQTLPCNPKSYTLQLLS